MGKLKAIFVLAENLSLVLTKLNTELGLAQPHLVILYLLLENISIYYPFKDYSGGRIFSKQM